MANINNINTENTWLDVETVAKLKNISRRGVRLSLNQDRYEYKVEKVKGGKTYKVKLSSLEEEYQIKYIKEYYNDLTSVNGEIIELQNFNVKQEKLISENQKKMALGKYDLIKKWEDYRKQNKIKTEAGKEFLEMYNRELLHGELFEQVGTVAIRTIYEWHKKLKTYNDDWHCLIKNYTFGEKTKKSALTPSEEEQFLKILLHPNKINIGKATKMTKCILLQRGVSDFCYDMTYRRFANTQISTDFVLKI